MGKVVRMRSLIFGDDRTRYRGRTWRFETTKVRVRPTTNHIGHPCYDPRYVGMSRRLLGISPDLLTIYCNFRMQFHLYIWKLYSIAVNPDTR